MMGYTNGLAAAAVRMIVKDDRGVESDVVALFTQNADSNLYTDDGKMSRSWNLLQPQEEWRVMQSVVEISASCEGGMLRWKGSSNTKAETFIAACRKAIEMAPYVDNLRNLGDGQIGQYCLELPITIDKLGRYNKEQYEKLLQTDIPRKQKYDDVTVFEFSPDAAGLAEYLKWSSLGGMYCWGTSAGTWDFDTKKFDQWAQPLRAPVYKKPKLESGIIVDLESGSSYTLSGEKFTRFEILSSAGTSSIAKGVRADGSRTADAFELSSLSRCILPTKDGIAILASSVLDPSAAPLFRNEIDESNDFGQKLNP